MKVWHIRLVGRGGYVVDEVDLSGLSYEIESAEVGDEFTIVVAEMFEEEYEALPEFEGF